MTKASVELEDKILAIEKKFGDGSGLKRATEFGVPDIFSTGFSEIDDNILVCGGFPKGRMSEIAGESGAGKSTLALNMIAKASKQGKSCIYADLEGTMTYEYGELIGIGRKEWLIYQGKEGESGAEFLDKVLEMLESKPDILVLDSLSFVASEKVSETNIADVTMNTTMSTPTMTKMFAQKLLSGWSSFFDTAKKVENKKKITLRDCGTTLIIINHLKEKIGETYGRDRKDSGGGETIKFAYTVRLILERLSVVTDKTMLDEGGNPYLVKCKLTCRKNKLGPVGRFSFMHINTKTGQFQSDNKTLIEFAIKKGVVTESSSHITLTQEFCDNSLLALVGKNVATNRKFHGRAKFLAWVASEPKVEAYIWGRKA